MFTRSILAMAVTVLAGSAALAQDGFIILRDYRPHCRSRVTEIQKVPVGIMGMHMPRMMGPGTDTPMGAPVTLNCKDWQGGRTFTDQNGRRWQMVGPMPLKQTPQMLHGCIYKGPDGQSFFSTMDGLLFVELPKV